MKYTKMLYIYHHINKIFEVDIEEGALHRNQLAAKKKQTLLVCLIATVIILKYLKPFLSYKQS